MSSDISFIVGQSHNHCTRTSKAVLSPVFSHESDAHNILQVPYVQRLKPPSLITANHTAYNIISTIGAASSRAHYYYKRQARNRYDDTHLAPEYRKVDA
jgi:hypothetical protein